MKIQIRPSKSNHFPLLGFIIQSTSPMYWIEELQRMKLTLAQTRIIPVPGLEVNSLWGCLIITKEKLESDILGRHQECQQVAANLYIPERTKLTPFISQPELKTLFPTGIYLFHPEIGLAQLDNSFEIESLLMPSEEKYRYVFAPEHPAFTPTEIKKWELKYDEEQRAIDDLMKEIVPKNEKLPNDKLTLKEQVKLKFYKQLFKKGKDGKTIRLNEDARGSGAGGLLSGLAKLGLGNGIFDSDHMERMQQDFEQLEERSKSQMDKLMKMLDEDPENALKYAIPLDETGAGRGDQMGSFELAQRWGQFNWGSSDRVSGSGGFTMPPDLYLKIQQKYRKSAEDLIEKGDYKKAAFVYFKLLKSYHEAAQTLEKGEHFKEAAEVYQEHCKNKDKAADCYLKGNMPRKSIKLYEELNNHIKVGEIYDSLNERKKACAFYEKEIERMTSDNAYFEAHEIYKERILDNNKAKNTLLSGWTNGRNRFRCLQSYFDYFADPDDRRSEIHNVYNNTVNSGNTFEFLSVLESEYQQEENTKFIKNLAYEIISKNADSDKRILAKLKTFKPDDNQIDRDIRRHKK